MKYNKGEIVKGKVINATNYGIFVKLDDEYKGLVHISEISNNFVKDIISLVNTGDEIYVKLISEPDNQNRIDLSIKNIDYKFNNNHIISNDDEDKYSFKTLSEKLNIWVNNKLN